ncbi:MAG: 16S rRNA (guanine(966)-N(2))-methyltransferase RsmD [Clostridia bacterium]|nr:16S rRNA (guanine(966)-N(2))-methyltransferase RsmD [Clostridia bacterium]
MMRIITGSARGTKLATPPGLETRPTAERTKEAVFSSIQYLTQHAEVLDLFGGSGQMALEALSRGAAEAVIVDSAQEAIRAIRENLVRTHLEGKAAVIQANSLRYLETLEKQFSLVFLDPPYAKGLLPQVLRIMARRGTVRQGGLVICESASTEDVFGTDDELKQHYTVVKTAKYGKAFITYLEPLRERGVL